MDSVSGGASWDWRAVVGPKEETTLGPYYLSGGVCIRIFNAWFLENCVIRGLFIYLFLFFWVRLTSSDSMHLDSIHLLVKVHLLCFCLVLMQWFCSLGGVHVIPFWHLVTSNWFLNDFVSRDTIILIDINSVYGLPSADETHVSGLIPPSH